MTKPVVAPQVATHTGCGATTGFVIGQEQQP
jgi:hypothetical protein